MRDNYRLWSYLDDLVVAVPAAMVNHTMHYATAALEGSGYTINWGKLEIYAKVGPPQWLPDPLQNEAPEARRDVPDWTTKWTTDGVILLGADQLEPGTTGFQPRPPVWIGSVDFHHRTCQAVLQDISTLTDHLETLLQHASDRAPALAIALLLFRLCIHSKLVYTLRSAYSVGILRLSTQLDSHFQAKLREWIDLPEFDSPLATYLLQAPLRYGGLGITSLRKLAPEAYIGSWGLVLSAVQKQVGNHRYPVLGRTHGSPTTAQLATTAALAELPDGVLDVEAAVQNPVPKLQKKMTQARSAQEFHKLMATLDPTEATLLSNLAAKGSSTFLTAYPADHHTALANDDLRLILRFRLHLDVLQKGTCSKCRAPVDSKADTFSLVAASRT